MSRSAGTLPYYPTEKIFDARYVFCYRKSGWKVKEQPEPVCLLRPRTEAGHGRP